MHENLRLLHRVAGNLSLPPSFRPDAGVAPPRCAPDWRDSMNRDHLKGGISHLRGRIKTAAGAVRGRASDQLDGAYEQAAGAAQYAYGEARDTVGDLRHGGAHLVEEARARFRDVSERGHALADEALERGQHNRERAVRHGRTLAARADENRGTTFARVASVAFGLGWLARPTR